MHNEQTENNETVSQPKKLITSTPDYTGDRYWANVLAKRIENYWRKKGYPNVKTWLETDTNAFNKKTYSVRSNIVFNVNDLYN